MHEHLQCIYMYTHMYMYMKKEKHQCMINEAGSLSELCMCKILWRIKCVWYRERRTHTVQLVDVSNSFS